MSELEKVSLARILCDNSDIETMQPDAFRLVSTRYQSVAAVWSTLIGRAMSRLVSHWSRASIVMLRQQSYAIKNQLGHPKPPTRGFGTQNTPY